MGLGIAELDDRQYLRRERRLVAVFLFFVMMTLTFFVFTNWNGAIRVANAIRAKNGPTEVAYAPDVYRVAMPALYRAMDYLHIDRAVALATTDFVFGYLAVYLTYLLVTDRLGTLPKKRFHRAAVVLSFLAVVQFPVAWVVSWQRPETMPTAFFVAAATAVMLRLNRSALWIAALVVLTFLQALTRADAPCFFGLAVFVLAVAGHWLDDFAARGRCIAAGVAIAGTAVLVQGYLQLMRFPHMSYPPGVPQFMLLQNMSPHFLVSFCAVMLPVVAILVAGVRAKVELRSVDRLAITAAFLYVPVWCAVGSLVEVRIFVPFLLLLTVPASRILAALLPGVPEREVSVAGVKV